LKTVGVLHEWGYTLTPGENCVFDLTDQDISTLVEAWNLLHGDEQDSELNLRDGDYQMLQEMKEDGAN